MKKAIVTLLLLLGMVCMFAACNSTPPETTCENHVFGEWTMDKAPSCTEKGSERRICENCGHFETRTIDAGHTNQEAVVENKIDATCTADGSYDSVVYCFVCNIELSRITQTEASSGHDYDAVVTPPTKTEDGYTTYTCSVCGHSYKDMYVRATGSVGLSYTVNSDKKTCSVTGIGTCKDTEIIIPKTIDNYTVTRIEKQAFKGHNLVTSIKIPITVISIGDYAFSGTGITECTIPSSVTSIGTQIFFGCNSLTTVYYNSSYSNYSNAFLNIPSLRRVVFWGSKVPEYILFNNEYVTEIEVKESVTSIEPNSLAGCTAVKNIIIRGNITTIKSGSFSDSSALRSIVIPKSVKTVEEYSFDWCSSLYIVYYEGTEADWGKISIGSGNNDFRFSMQYYYSEEQPTTSGNYWRYVDGVPTAW